MPTPSVHDPRGILAAETASLGVLMFALAGVVFALVVVLLLLAIFRRRQDANDLEPRLDQGRRVGEGGVSFIVLGGLGLPLVILAPLLVVTLRTMAVLATPPRAGHADPRSHRPPVLVGGPLSGQRLRDRQRAPCAGG